MKQKKVKNEMKRRRHRLTFALVALVMIVLFGGLFATLNPPSRSTPLSNQSIRDGFALTATDLIGQLTVANIDNRMTQIAEVGGTVPPLSTRTPDDFVLTASEILGQMTQNAESVIMTQEALGIETNTPDPTLVARATEIMVTIDAVIRESTQDAMFLTDVAEGVSTFTPFDEIVEDWIVKIESRLGFTHPELALIVEKLLAQYQSDLQTLNFVKLSALAQSVKYNDIDYITVTMNVTSHSSYGSELLIFAINDDFVELVFQHTTGEFLSDLSGLILADFNHNGLLNFGITFGNYGDCPTSRLIVLEITADGVKDISPPLEEQRTYVHNSYSLFPAINMQPVVIHSVQKHPIKGYPEDCESLDYDATFSWDGERYTRIDHLPIPLHGSATPDD